MGRFLNFLKYLPLRLNTVEIDQSQRHFRNSKSIRFFYIPRSGLVYCNYCCFETQFINFLHSLSPWRTLRALMKVSLCDVLLKCLLRGAQCRFLKADPFLAFLCVSRVCICLILDEWYKMGCIRSLPSLAIEWLLISFRLALCP